MTSNNADHAIVSTRELRLDVFEAPVLVRLILVAVGDDLGALILAGALDVETLPRLAADLAALDGPLGARTAQRVQLDPMAARRGAGWTPR